MKVPKLFKKQLGFTLIEIIIVLAIMGTAIAGVLYYQSKAENSQKTNNAIQALTTMASSIKANFGPSGSYAGVTVATMISGGMIYDPFIAASATSLLDPWGNTISDASSSVIGVLGQFAIKIGPVSKENCVAIANGLVNNAIMVSVGTVTAVTAAVPVGGKIYKASAAATPNTTNLLDTTDGCGMAADATRFVAAVFH